MKEAVLTFANASCAHCARLVTRSLERLEGVEIVQVDPDERRLLVDFDPTHVSVEGIRSLMERAGYPSQLLYVSPRMNRQTPSFPRAA